MSWAGRRQFYYSSGLLIFICGVLAFFLYPLIFKAPTCSDGKQNGTEMGVDCGGSCMRFCPAQVSDPIVLWSRVFPVTGSNYNLVAYIENQNINAGIQDINYEFRVYDTEGKYIGRREGHTYIPPNQRYAIFESHFDAGKNIPKNATFMFTGPYNYIKKESITSKIPLRIDRIIYSEESGAPRLQARIYNDSIFYAPEFDVITILYDEDHNAIGVSKTHLDNLEKNQSSPIIFTWPVLFAKTPAVKDILPQINPFLLQF